jgi:hypothetical protein
MAKKKAAEKVKRHPLDVAKDAIRGNHVELDVVAIAKGYYTPYDKDNIAEGASRIVVEGEEFEFHGFLSADGYLPEYLGPADGEEFEPKPKASAVKALEKEESKDIV